MQTLFLILLLFSAIILILIILVQRGKGGGLAGALGGMGGQSAFGSKAGDTFTRITVAIAAVWILLCLVSVRALSTGGGPQRLEGGDENAAAAPSEPGQDATDEQSATGGDGDQIDLGAETTIPTEPPADAGGGPDLSPPSDDAVPGDAGGAETSPE